MAGTLNIWRFFITCSLVFLLSAISTAISIAECDTEGPRGDSTCWLGPVPEGTDPCGLIEQAQGLFVRLSNPVENHVQELAAGLDIERSLRVQQRLLREHLFWLDDDLTERQLDLLIFLAVALSLDRAQERTAELHRLLEKTSELKLEQSLQNVELYLSQALSLLGKLSARVKEVSDRELEIRL